MTSFEKGGVHPCLVQTWGPIVAMNGLHSVALALAEQIDAAKVRAWIVNDCGLALDSARDVDMFVGRFRNLRIFSFTARLSNLAGRRGRDSFQSILNLRTLEQFEMDLHNDPQWMMRSTFYGDIARSRAPLVRLKLQVDTGRSLVVCVIASLVIKAFDDRHRD